MELENRFNTFVDVAKTNISSYHFSLAIDKEHRRNRLYVVNAINRIGKSVLRTHFYPRQFAHLIFPNQAVLVRIHLIDFKPLCMIRIVAVAQ